jgi:hypothetical protein
VREAEIRNCMDTKRFTKIRELIEVGWKLHSKATEPRLACKNVLNADSEISEDNCHLSSPLLFMSPLAFPAPFIIILSFISYHL